MYGTGNGASEILQAMLQGEANHKWPQMLKSLDEEIRHIQEASWKYQKKIMLDRASGHESKNRYAEGDLVIFTHAKTT